MTTKRFTVVTIKRVRADYVVEAADERDAWNRVAAVERGEESAEDTWVGVTVLRKPMEIEHERFVVEIPERSR